IDGNDSFGVAATLTGGGAVVVTAAHQVEINDRVFVITASLGGTGLLSRELTDKASLRTVDSEPTGAAKPGADITAIDSLEVEGRTFVIAASAFDDTLMIYRLNGAGDLAEAARIGAAEGLGIAASGQL